MRKVKKIYNIQPLQISTVELVPGCTIPGTIGSAVNVTGADVAAKLTITRNGNDKLVDGLYTITVLDPTPAEEGPPAVDAIGHFSVTDQDGNVVTGQNSGADPIYGVIPGIKLVVADVSAITKGHSASFKVIGDQTYIIPGTVLGRLKAGTNAGKWKPVNGDDDNANFDIFRIATGFQQTDKGQTVIPYGYEKSLSNVYTIDVAVFAELYAAASTAINMTSTLQALIKGVNWL